VNRAYGRSHFWDGRAPTLEEQVTEPIGNPKELDLSMDEAVDRLARSRTYRAEFEAAFGRAVSPTDLARALASYVRTILSGNSAFDRYVNGDRAALSDEARRGLEVFRGKGNCATCHGGPTLSDERFHNTGVAWRDSAFQDPGRVAVTRNEDDRGAFRTPTLREVARTAPYMHDGSLPTLEAVVEYYDRGGNRAPRLDPEIRPLHLTNAEKLALLAFLSSLSGEIRDGWR
jgi:cytochrome c peroxidase